MDANEARLKEKLEHHLEQAKRLAAEIQALEQGDQVPHFDQIECQLTNLARNSVGPFKANAFGKSPLRNSVGCTVLTARNSAESRLK